VYVIAEAGSNHDGSFDQALRLIDVAAEQGADAVKFQAFRADRLYARSAGVSDYLGSEKPIFEIIHDMEMPLEWIPRLARHAAQSGLDFLATPFDERMVDAIEPYVPALKIASYEMTHHPLLAYAARKGKPVLLSTGAATLDEVGEAVAVVRNTGNGDLVLLQCTAKYPAPLASLNVRAMTTLRESYDVQVGFSDHSREPLTGPLAAVALGAIVVEKHFTLSNQLPGPDHNFALEPAELGAMIREIRAITTALGSGTKVPHAQEAELRAFARRSIFATRPIAAGEPLTADNVAVLRCGKLGYGLHPRDYASVLGRRATRTLAADELIAWEKLA
jgi:sialic acid synthase SpsE